jgi:hypothetical protein
MARARPGEVGFNQTSLRKIQNVADGITCVLIRLAFAGRTIGIGDGDAEWPVAAGCSEARTTVSHIQPALAGFSRLPKLGDRLLGRVRQFQPAKRLPSLTRILA